MKDKMADKLSIPPTSTTLNLKHVILPKVNKARMPALCWAPALTVRREK